MLRRSADNRRSIRSGLGTTPTFASRSRFANNPDWIRRSVLWEQDSTQPLTDSQQGAPPSPEGTGSVRVYGIVSCLPPLPCTAPPIPKTTQDRLEGGGSPANRAKTGRCDPQTHPVVDHGGFQPNFHSRFSWAGQDTMEALHGFLQILIGQQWAHIYMHRARQPVQRPWAHVPCILDVPLCSRPW